FGEVSVESRAAFNQKKHLTRKDVFLGLDLNGKTYARLDLPSAKTARPGEIQSVYLVSQGTLCPIAALQNLASAVPALAEDPLFSWRDRSGAIRPMVKHRALERINNIITAWGWSTAFGHSFRIGGASFYPGDFLSPRSWAAITTTCNPIVLPANLIKSSITFFWCRDRYLLIPIKFCQGSNQNV
ncbi:hypothetical protein K503DRAFT_814403, partial [Rhizopogon vinicolor AM-OR11-026]